MKLKQLTCFPRLPISCHTVAELGLQRPGEEARFDNEEKERSDTGQGHSVRQKSVRLEAAV